MMGRVNADARMGGSAGSGHGVATAGFLLLAGLLISPGCVRVLPPGTVCTLDDAMTHQWLADGLDEVARYLEEWGTLSMSGPMITRSTGPFQFNLDLSDRELFAGNTNPEGAALVRQYLEATARVGVGVKLPEAGEGDAVSVQAPEPPSITTQPAGGGGLNPYTGALAMSQRRRIRLTASDRFELGLHKLLSKPEGLVGDVETFFFVFTVSCQPGWRTQKDFAGYVEGRLEYTLKGEPVDASAGAVHPVVVAVYPAFDSQELDLRSSRRQLLAIAASLAAAGNQMGVKAFLSAAERLEQDVETRSGLAQVTSYCQGGRNFGFELRPALRALGEPERKRARPEMCLDSVSFPAVAVVVGDWGAIESTRTVANRILQVGKEDVRGATELMGFRMGNPEGYRKAVARVRKEVVVRLHITHGWRPLAGPAMANVPGFAQIGRLFQQRVWEQHRASQVMRVQDALKLLAKLEADSTKHQDLYGQETAGELRDRWAMFQAQLLNLSPKLSISLEPPPPPLLVTDLRPRVGRLGEESAFLIQGSGFRRDGDPATVAIAGAAPNPGKVRAQVLGPKLIQVVVESGALAQPAGGLAFQVKVGDEIAFTPPFAMVGEPQTVSIEVDRANGGINRVTIPRLGAGMDKDDFDRIEKILRHLTTVPRRDPNQAAEIRLDVKAQRK